MTTGGDAAASIGVKQSAAASKKRERLANTFLYCMTTFLELHCLITFGACRMCEVIDCKTCDRRSVLSRVGHIGTSGACCNSFFRRHSDGEPQYVYISPPG